MYLHVFWKIACATSGYEYAMVTLSHKYAQTLLRYRDEVYKLRQSISESIDKNQVPGPNDSTVESLLGLAVVSGSPLFFSSLHDLEHFTDAGSHDHIRPDDKFGIIVTDEAKIKPLSKINPCTDRQMLHISITGCRWICREQISKEYIESGMLDWVYVLRFVNEKYTAC